VYLDALVERDTPTQRLYVQQDANWNSTAVFDTSGNVQERYIYDPYGVFSVLSPTWATLSGTAFAWNYLHQGGRFDSVTGLYNFRHRDYSPALGRWEQPDPLEHQAGDSDLYRYERSQPTSERDPRGLRATPMPLLEKAVPH